MNVLDALNDRWDETAMHHEWTTPDGHIAHVKVIEHIDGILDNEGLELPYRFSKNQPSKVGTSLAPNFIHSLDGFTVRYIVENVDFNVSHIHDEIQAHPNHMGRVRELYQDSFRIVSEGKYLEKFCGKDFGIDSSEFLAGLEDSQYSLC
jgi:DNA-directed RNA polymerase